MSLYHLLTSIVAWEVSHNHIIIPLCAMCHFSLATFKIFSLSLGFRSWIMGYYRVDFFLSSLFGVHSASWFHKFKSPAEFGKLSDIISSSNFVSPALFLVSFWNSVTWMLDLLFYIQNYLKLSSFFPPSPFTFWYSDCVILFCSLLHWFFPLIPPFCC